MKNYKKTLTGILGVLLVSILLAGCSDIFTPPGATDTNEANFGVPVDHDLSRRDYLALLKTQDNHKTTIDELQDMASSLLKTNENVRSVASSGAVITGTRRLEGFGEKRFAPSTSARSVGAAEEDPVEIYELTIGDTAEENVGFILASNDDRVGYFLAIAEGSLADTDNPFVEVLNANLDDYINATISEYNAMITGI